MCEPLLNASGTEIAAALGIDDRGILTCTECGAIDEEESAYDNGWQLTPPLCPDCLRWVAVATDETCCFDGPRQAGDGRR